MSNNVTVVIIRVYEHADRNHSRWILDRLKEDTNRVHITDGRIWTLSDQIFFYHYSRIIEDACNDFS